MDFTTSRSLSYQPLISRRRSSVTSDKSISDSAPSSPVEARVERRESAVKYVYTCEKCGFGTNLLSSYMPHTSNPCGTKDATDAWRLF
ncbi:hypothetical protein H4S02_000063 [Coemansia sp. RSA 2611]|nr:hypothetical protein IWW51_003441 [Coemansia sp. RSA 2702]KAJ2393646.1 hypothetical protein H4S02_000063 [Coemansia sp. RSA 2611]